MPYSDEIPDPAWCGRLIVIDDPYQPYREVWVEGFETHKAITYRADDAHFYETVPDSADITEALARAFEWLRSIIDER